MLLDLRGSGKLHISCCACNVSCLLLGARVSNIFPVLQWPRGARQGRRAVVKFIFDLICFPDLEANQARCARCCEGKV